MSTRVQRFIREVALSATLLAGVSPCVIPAAIAAPQTPVAPSANSRWKHFPSPPMAPAGAPNVLLILTDDVGFGASSTFGGAIPTPTFEALARSGLRYNEFHTTAMCSPTRAALLTGRNHHAVASGSISNVAIDEEGYTSVIPRTAATIAQVLHLNGYDTAWLGKNHNTPVWETGPMGPFERWPNGLGFDYFYGFNAAATDQFVPELVENRNSVDPPTNDPSYHLDRDLANHLIHWLGIQHTVHPNHPFFAYLAPGSMHSPHQAPREWIEKFKGRFDQGWDKLREETFARQKQLGVIPKDAVLTPRPASLPAWDSLSATQKRVYARMMEVAAGQLAHADYQIGRIVDSLRKSGELDNTLVIYIQGDNGGSLESLRGANNELQTLMGIEPTDAEIAQGIEQHGGRNAYGNYPAAWAWATDTPFQWGKQVASHLGGLRDGMVISWPNRIKQVGQIRSQFHHVIDVAPTIYEAAGISAPQSVDGFVQQPIDGTSMLYTFDHAGAASTRHEQYFEMLGNRAYYKDGWIASTTPGVLPFDRSNTAVDPLTYGWELYDLRHDYSQSHDLAKQFPAKLAELKADFDTAARQYHIYPVVSNIMGRLGPGTRPSPIEGLTRFTYEAGDTRYAPNSFPTLGNSWLMTAHIELMSAAAQGPIVVQGDVSGGMGLTLEQGRATFLYNPSGRADERVQLQAAAPLTPGAHDVRFATEPRAGAGPRAARLLLSVDGGTPVSVDVPILYAVHGDAYIGREGLGPLLPGETIGPLTGAVVRSVDIDTKAR
ncbi:MAG TPA: arylsulfatase [Steroidobacteraceae bacterium]|nr:arylsulfatase [Steroidobacteraceae bacterium]